MDRKHLWLTVLGFFFLLVLSGCFRHESVRHLAGDACLISPEKSTKQEVLSYLGAPDERRMQPDGGEEWIYYQANKSLLRKTPYFGNNLGYEKYDVLNVSFRGNLVRTCSYRLLAEKEFRQSREAHPE